jgi:hypothetical protein
MDLTYLYAVVALLGTTFELAAVLTGRFVQRKDRALRKPRTASAGCVENVQLVRQANNQR